MKYSIIFLVEKEDEEFIRFFDLIYRLFCERKQQFEILVVANGTESFVISQLNSRTTRLDELKVISFHRRVPQSACLNIALSESRGSEILTLGPFQELSVSSYERLVDSMTDTVDLIVPYRKKRKDPFINRLHSRLLNKVIKMMIGIKINDIGCSVKFFRREVLEGMNLYGDMYRYFSALAVQKGFRVKEIECDQSEKARKAKMYNLRLYLDRSIEIFNLFFSTNFSKKPLRFFSFVGSSFMAFGLIALMYIGLQKLLLDMPIGARSLLIIAIMSLVGGAQIASFGLLGEIISFVHGRSRKEYTIEKII